MKLQDIWAHMKKRKKNGFQGASLLYEIFYHKKSLVSKETFDAVYHAVNTPICTGVTYGMQARQIAEKRQKEKEEMERPRTEQELKEIERRKAYGIDGLWDNSGYEHLN
jgi:dTDP-4-dehydrorhamnose reductase